MSLISSPTTTIRLRAPEPSDVDCMYLWENNPEMWRYGFSPAPLSRHQIWEYIQRYDADPIADRQLRLMIAELISCTGNERSVGTVDLYNIDIRNRHAFIGIMIAKEHRRRGLAMQALALLIQYCRCNLGIEQLAATVAADNKPSLDLFIKAGFKQIAVIPRWICRPDGVRADAHLLTIMI